MNGFVMEVCNERDYTKTKSIIERKNGNLFYLPPLFGVKFEVRKVSRKKRGQ